MGHVVAAVLAGGEGKRFRPYTDLVPKPMLPVGPEERPILEYIVAWLAKHGLKEIVLLVGYKWRQIANYFRDGGPWGVHIQYSVDSGGYAGTGGALLKAYHCGLLSAEHTLVWYGDILAALDLHDVLRFHEESGADATLVLADRYQVPVGVAEVDSQSNIVRLEEKPWLPLHVTIGVLVLRTSVLGHVEERLGRSFDIMGEMIPLMIKESMKVKAYVYRGPWLDVGSLERYAKLDPRLLREILGVAEAPRTVAGVA